MGGSNYNVQPTGLEERRYSASSTGSVEEKQQHAPIKAEGNNLSRPESRADAHMDRITENEMSKSNRTPPVVANVSQKHADVPATYVKSDSVPEKTQIKESVQIKAESPQPQYPAPRPLQTPEPKRVAESNSINGEAVKVATPPHVELQLDVKPSAPVPKKEVQDEGIKTDKNAKVIEAGSKKADTTSKEDKPRVESSKPPTGKATPDLKIPLKPRSAARKG